MAVACLHLNPGNWSLGPPLPYRLPDINVLARCAKDAWTIRRSGPILREVHFGNEAEWDTIYRSSALPQQLRDRESVRV